MEVGWGGEGGMVGNIGLLASHLSHLTRYHRPQKVILPVSLNETFGHHPCTFVRSALRGRTVCTITFLAECDMRQSWHSAI